jgi:hypothetical protein
MFQLRFEMDFMKITRWGKIFCFLHAWTQEEEDAGLRLLLGWSWAMQAGKRKETSGPLGCVRWKRAAWSGAWIHWKKEKRNGEVLGHLVGHAGEKGNRSDGSCAEEKRRKEKEE